MFFRDIFKPSVWVDECLNNDGAVLVVQMSSMISEIFRDEMELTLVYDAIEYNCFELWRRIRNLALLIL